MGRARAFLSIHLHPLTLLLSLLLLSGCADLDLGPAPFICHKGKPECPEGYTCQEVDNQRICVKDGTIAPTADGSVDVGNGGTDSTVDGFAPPPDGPRPDQSNPSMPTVAITEFMADPKAVSDSTGEWLELFNTSNMPVDINGWTLRDNDTDAHIIVAGGPLLIPAQGYLLLGRSTDVAQNGGVTVSYAYSDFFLANATDEIILLDGSGNTVDSISYSANTGFSIPAGASLSVKNPVADKSQPSAWCTETSPWTGSAGDSGTPGAPPGC